MLVKKLWDADGKNALRMVCAETGVLLVVLELAAFTKAISSNVPTGLAAAVDEAMPACNPVRLRGVGREMVVDAEAADAKKL